MALGTSPTSGDHGPMSPPLPELEVLAADECRRLLRTQTVGRLAVAEPGVAPLVVPVVYLVDDDGRVVFRSDFGEKLRLSVLAELPVSFQVDHIDPAARTGWSLLVSGRAEELGEWEAGGLHLPRWVAGSKSHWVRIHPESLSGRRIALANPEQRSRTSDVG